MIGEKKKLKENYFFILIEVSAVGEGVWKGSNAGGLSFVGGLFIDFQTS